MSTESGIESVDVIVIGSGPAGSTFARCISDLDNGTRVLVLEAGPSLSRVVGAHVTSLEDPKLLRKAQIASQGPHQLDYAVMDNRTFSASPDQLRDGLYLLSDVGEDSAEFPAGSASSNAGGMAAHWFGGTPRPAGVERISFISETEMDMAFDTAERLLKVSNESFPSSDAFRALLSRASDLFDEGREPSRRVREMPMAASTIGNRVVRHGPSVILDEILMDESRRVELRPGSFVESIAIEGRNAVGVDVRGTDGMTIRIKSRALVVAADSFRTPQLLFASGVRPPALGRHLNEHTQVSVLFEESDRPPSEVHSESTAGVMGDPVIRALPMSGCIFVPFTDDFPFSVQILEIDPTTLPSLAKKKWTGGAVFAASFFLLSDPNADNRVTFDLDDVDWFGLPKMEIRYHLTAAERARVERAKAVATELASHVGVLLREPLLNAAGSSLHYQGTLRMGPVEDGLSVCDPTSRVWGTDNIWVGGNGVIPTPTAGNPTLTSVALASIAAEAIARQLSSERRADSAPIDNTKGMTQ